MNLVNVNVRLDVSVCTNKQWWNNDKCRSECKELTKENAIIDLFGILVTLNVNVINQVMLKNI